MFCPNCGAPIEISGARFCGNCGENIENIMELITTYDDPVEDNGSIPFYYEIDSENNPENNEEKTIVDHVGDGVHEDVSDLQEISSITERDGRITSTDEYSKEDSADEASDTEKTQTAVDTEEKYDTSDAIESDEYSEEYESELIDKPTFSERLLSVNKKTRAILVAVTFIIMSIIVGIVIISQKNKQPIVVSENSSQTAQTESSDNTASNNTTEPTKIETDEKNDVADEQEMSTEDILEANKIMLLQASTDFKENKADNEYSWLVSPGISADDIQTVVRERPTYDYGKVDYNSIGKYKYDRTVIIRSGNNLGLMAYNGLPLCDVYFTDIYAGYDTKYIIERPESDVYYTLNDKYEQVRLNDYYEDVLDITGTAPNEELYWADNEGNLFDFETSVVPEYTKAAAAVYMAFYDDVFYMGADYVPKYILVKDGKPIKRILFEGAGCFCDGVIPVKLNGKWGYVNENCDVVLPFIFDDVLDGKAYNVTDELIVVRKDGQYALYDINGKKLIDFGVFEQMRPVYKGMMWVKSNGKWGIISVREGAHDIYPYTPEIEGSGYKSRVHSSDGLRLREKADTNSAVLGILSNRQEVEVLLSSQNGWAFIRVKENVCGWVREDYLE